MDKYPKSEEPTETVGGSEGQACAALAHEFSNLESIVQDFQPVVNQRKSRVPADVAGRIMFMAHDFLTEQPVRNADVYLLRQILHNWSDKYYIRILRHLVTALKTAAKIVVNDNVSTDLTMKVLQNPHERGLDDWKNLFKTADPRFSFQEAKQPAGSTLWIMTVQWEGQ
ncbi:uncharacterized protein JN550_012439 [Neoarthrinium moseri]|uniref:uncharacterized protein n=1 Tax=Neoarthrinium moseri TaxID=1658444 RepID=UPI001FDB320E|nr:uncharacterized protein JN550_012439 [Neoarthrinium moseri]KAI1858785.1 hypothetical protein JN550_012439 [Neoarthrinium moseri]